MTGSTQDDLRIISSFRLQPLYATFVYPVVGTSVPANPCDLGDLKLQPWENHGENFPKTTSGLSVMIRLPDFGTVIQFFFEVKLKCFDILMYCKLRCKYNMFFAANSNRFEIQL